MIKYASLLMSCVLLFGVPSYYAANADMSYLSVESGAQPERTVARQCLAVTYRVTSGDESKSISKNSIEVNMLAMMLEAQMKQIDLLQKIVEKMNTTSCEKETKYLNSKRPKEKTKDD